MSENETKQEGIETQEGRPVGDGGASVPPGASDGAKDRIHELAAQQREAREELAREREERAREREEFAEKLARLEGRLDESGRRPAPEVELTPEFTSEAEELRYLIAQQNAKVDQLAKETAAQKQQERFARQLREALGTQDYGDYRDVVEPLVANKLREGASVRDAQAEAQRLAKRFGLNKTTATNAITPPADPDKYARDKAAAAAATRAPAPASTASPGVGAERPVFKTSREALAAADAKLAERIVRGGKE